VTNPSRSARAVLEILNWEEVSRATIDVRSSSEPRCRGLRVRQLADASFAVVGELDMNSAPVLEERLSGVTGPIRLDLRGTTFVDSCGIAALVRVHRRCHAEGHALIAACSASVERLLQLVDLRELLTEPSPLPG
jgi:anti-anti-sigma factor